MKIRNTTPNKDNKYYIMKGYGGWSPCIQGYPAYFQGSVLANCVGLATGRFNEIGEYDRIKYAIAGNAENWIDNCPSTLTHGKEPKQGCIMVWQRGATKQERDGAGHVAIVEKVINDYTIYTSESGYGGKIFYNDVKQYANEWGKGGEYHYLGCIYNPAVPESTTLLEDWQRAAYDDGYYFGDVDNLWGRYCEYAASSINLRYGSTQTALVKWLQTTLWMYGYYWGGVDGDFGNVTREAVLAYQKRWGLAQDGVVGRYTTKMLLCI